ncbi:MAG: PspA/IM30 family protein [Phyllobacteriaceae bacterium]|nr:PspA/IM30 family protein [Phyllobacteriaceae bacterium]
MSENLIARVRRLVNANINDVVDRMEKSQAVLVMKEAVREMDRAVTDIRAEQGKALQRVAQADRQIAAYKTKLADLAGKLDLAVSEARDDLAKAAISRQMDYEAQIKVLGEGKAEAEAEQAKLAEYVEALQARKRDMEADVKVLMDAQAAVAAAMPDVAKPDGPVNRADVAAEAFRRAMESASSVQGARTTDADQASKLAELEKLSRSQQVESRLAEAKLRKAS